MICAIHQPNFFPYYPIFQKMDAADVFVILGDCQFEKNNYQNRFHIGDDWYTMSVNKGLEPIRNKRYVNYVKDWNKIKVKLPQYADTFSALDFAISENLLLTNTLIIRILARRLGINTDKMHSTRCADLTSTARLVRLCQLHNCDEYLSGIGGKRYLDVEQFHKAGIHVRFQDEATMIRKPVLEVIGR